MKKKINIHPAPNDEHEKGRCENAEWNGYESVPVDCSKFHNQKRACMEQTLRGDKEVRVGERGELRACNWIKSEEQGFFLKITPKSHVSCVVLKNAQEVNK